MSLEVFPTAKARRRFLPGIGVSAAVFLICIAMIAPVFGQSASRPDRGFGGKGGYQTTDIDSISLQNGSLNVHIPLASLPSRLFLLVRLRNTRTAHTLHAPILFIPFTTATGSG